MQRRKRLRDYQRNALRWQLEHPRNLLAMQMRLGKTLITIRWLKAVGAQKTLILGPTSVLPGWYRELYSEGETSVEQLSGSRRKRYRLLIESEAKWILLNKEGVRAVPEIADIHWGAVILDERFITNPRSFISKFCVSKFHNVPYKSILSGTPAPESEEEYYQQLAFLNSDRIPRTYYQFQNSWFAKPIGERRSYQRYITRAGREKLAYALSDKAFFLTRKDIGIDETIVREPRWIDLPPKIRKIYDKVEKLLLLEMEGEELNRTIWTMTAWIWLRRIVGGVAPKTTENLDGEQITEMVHIWNGKEAEIISLLTGELSGEQVVIWADFREEIERLCRIFTKKQINYTEVHGSIPQSKREERRKLFQAKSVQILLGHPACFKHGTDLSVSDTMIYYSLPTSSETYQQSRERFMRIGKSSMLLELPLLVKNTIDEDIWRAHANKLRKDVMMRDIINSAKLRQKTL